MPIFGNIKTVEGVRVAIVNGTLLSVSAQDVREVDPTYTGAQLILASVDEVILCVWVFVILFSCCLFL